MFNIEILSNIKKLFLLSVVMIWSISPAPAQNFWKQIKEDIGIPSKSKKTSKTNETSANNNSKSSPQSATKILLERLHSMRNNFQPVITGKPLPETQGWTLVRSNTITGFKCDHYEKDGRSLRVFHKDNGDFITLNEDPDGLSREPIVSSTVGDTINICPIGEYRFTTKEGNIINGGFDDQDFHLEKDHTTWPEKWVIKKQKCKGIRLTYPNGNSITMKQAPMDMASATTEEMFGKTDYSSSRVSERTANCPINWLSFKSGKKELGVCNILYTHLSDHPTSQYLWLRSGIFINDRLYEVDALTGCIIKPIAQFVDKRFYPIIPTDTIVSATEKTIKNEFNIDMLFTDITYSNEDKLTVDEQGDGIYTGSLYVKEGTLHRNGGVFTFKTTNNRPTMRMTYPDGKFFVGKFAYKANEGIEEISLDYEANRWLSEERLIPWTGTYEYPDGTLENLTKGMSDKELAELKAKEEAAKQKEKEEKEKLNAQAKQELYNKYGQKYVDILLNESRFEIGMPIELIKLYFDCRLSYTSAYSQDYDVYGNAYRVTNTSTSINGRYHYTKIYMLSVRNGKVSNIYKYNN